MLDRFGFTPTETRIYRTMLSIGPSTGYVVARELGIARANVYQALESLVRRGAAQKSATDPVLYSAAGPSALVLTLERSFRRDLSQLEDALRDLPIAGAARPELELLTSADQVLARAASCADAAIAELLVVTGPWAAPLHERLPAASQRRVQVRVVSLGDTAPEGAPARGIPDEQLAAYWGGKPLAVVADKNRAVFGVLKGGEAASGIATSVPGVVPFIRHLLRRELAGS